MSEHTETVPSCKVEGCERPRASQFGPFGGLCQVHAAERRQRDGKANGAAPTLAQISSLTDLAMEAESARREFDSALRRLRDAIDTLQGAAQ